jgi:hypothetical protein
LRENDRKLIALNSLSCGSSPAQFHNHGTVCHNQLLDPYPPQDFQSERIEENRFARNFILGIKYYAEGQDTCFMLTISRRIVGGR